MVCDGTKRQARKGNEERRIDARYASRVQRREGEQRYHAV